MKNKSLIVSIGMITGIISVLGRISLAGWLFMIGLISIVIFGILHVIFLSQISKKYSKLTSNLRKIAWIGVFLFPLIFLFQFDFGDSAGNFYVYEYITGENDSKFEHYAFFIALASAISYICNFVVWNIKIKKIN